MDKSIFEYERKSYISIGEIYFWTATINQWKHLLKRDAYKDIIINSLKYLNEKGKIDVFAFVIMPNHIHLIWRINEMNGKETAQASFLKFTAHEFKRKLKIDAPEFLLEFAVSAHNKNYEFWKRDSLAIHLYSKEIAFQKLDYIHNNPLAEHWQLVKDPCEYKYSTCNFYNTGKKIFSFIKDLRDEF